MYLSLGNFSFSNRTKRKKIVYIFFFRFFLVVNARLGMGGGVKANLRKKSLHMTLIYCARGSVYEMDGQTKCHRNGKRRCL